MIKRDCSGTRVWNGDMVDRNGIKISEWGLKVGAYDRAISI